MRFSSLLAAVALAIPSVLAVPAILEARAEGTLDFFGKTGCKAVDRCVVGFGLQRGCQPIPAGCRYGAKLTALGSKCTVELHIDGACQDRSNVITLKPTEMNQCRQPSDVFGIQSVFTACTELPVIIGIPGGK